MKFHERPAIPEQHEAHEHEEESKPLISPELRTEYRDRIKLLMNQVINRNIDTLVFLDRSARPFSWLLRDMWKQEHKDRPLPEVKFVNIGTANFVHKGGTTAVKNQDFLSMPKGKTTS